MQSTRPSCRPRFRIACAQRGGFETREQTTARTVYHATGLSWSTSRRERATSVAGRHTICCNQTTAWASQNRFCCAMAHNEARARFLRHGQANHVRLMRHASELTSCHAAGTRQPCVIHVIGTQSLVLVSARDTSLALCKHSSRLHSFLTLPIAIVQGATGADSTRQTTNAKPLRSALLLAQPIGRVRHVADGSSRGLVN